MNYKIRNVLILVLTCFLLSGCGLYRVKRKPVEIDKVSNFPKLRPRAYHFLGCIKDLNHQGLRQGLIKELCIATFQTVD